MGIDPRVRRHPLSKTGEQRLVHCRNTLNRSLSGRQRLKNDEQLIEGLRVGNHNPRVLKRNPAIPELLND